jgi:hypothetical protein
MQNNTFITHIDGHQPDRILAGAQRIDDVLDQLLVQFSARFPELKIVIVGRTGQSPCPSPAP